MSAYSKYLLFKNNDNLVLFDTDNCTVVRQTLLPEFITGRPDQYNSMFPIRNPKLDFTWMFGIHLINFQLLAESDYPITTKSHPELFI
jgi:hypothetical protein